MPPSDLPSTDPRQAQRVELLLHQLECLPTPAAVALTLIEHATEERSGDRLGELAAMDPALAARLLRMCRSSAPADGDRIITVPQAIAQLGPAAVRAAALSVPVLEILDTVESPGGELPSDEPTFSREAYWQHSLAVATLCRTLAAQCEPEPIDPDVAYIAGLLHDMGLLALHVLLPRTFDRACRFAELNGLAVERASRGLIGLTAHTAGRRLCEHWRLPHLVGDVLWLHGQPSASLPSLGHRPVIELVTLADAAARLHYVTPVGHLPRGEDLAELARPLGLGPAELEEAVAAVHTEVAAAADTLGLGAADPPDAPRLLGALGAANQALGRLHMNASTAARRADSDRRMLEAITRFHDRAAPGSSLVSALGKVVRSARDILGGTYFAAVYQARSDQPWRFMRFASDGRLLVSEIVAPPADGTALGDLADEEQVPMRALSLLSWLDGRLEQDPAGPRPPGGLRLLPLRCGWGVHAVLLHDCPARPGRDKAQVEALSRTWASAVAAASHHAGAKRLGEQLAESNRALIEVRDTLTRREKLASLGEIAAGAAHEMNNPLTVISGRAQILVSRLAEMDEQTMAEQIVEQSHRLSDMISTLRSFAEAVEPRRRGVDLRELIQEQVDWLYREHSGVRVEIIVDQALPAVCIDPDHIGRAIRELLRNGAESQGSGLLEVSVQIDPLDDRLQVQITDDGTGLTKHALAHAFDPFFSAKSAGRQPGLGLAHARRLVEAHGGRITLENAPTRGAVASIWLDGWRVRQGEDAQAA